MSKRLLLILAIAAFLIGVIVGVITSDGPQLSMEERARQIMERRSV